MRILFALCSALLALTAHGADMETAATLKRSVETFVQQQLTGTPGASFTVGTIDPRLQLPKCAATEAYLPPGTRLWGNATVGLRCNAPVAWGVYVPVAVKVMGNVVVTQRPLAAGQTVDAADLRLQPQDLTQMPVGVLTDPAQAVGRTVGSGVPAGFPLRSDMLRSQQVVTAGQPVRLAAKGQGFTVYSEGRALGSASEGQPVQVRTPSGQVVKGIARAGGVVEIPF